MVRRVFQRRSGLTDAAVRASSSWRSEGLFGFRGGLDVLTAEIHRRLSSNDQRCLGGAHVQHGLEVQPQSIIVS